jgi:hypothetical protein
MVHMQAQKSISLIFSIQEKSKIETHLIHFQSNRQKPYYRFNVIKETKNLYLSTEEKNKFK